MFAVIETGGKQYVASAGKKIKIEKINAEEGADVSFDSVFLVSDGDNIKIGTPKVAGAKVEGRVTRNGRAKKVIVFKYHPKTRYRIKRGHRQHFTEVEIMKISA